jgi:hypothetical protein
MHAIIFSMDTTRRPLTFIMSHPEMGGRRFHHENLLDGPQEADRDWDCRRPAHPGSCHYSSRNSCSHQVRGRADPRSGLRLHEP